MPQGKGTYGSQVGRPRKKKKDAGPDDFSKGGRVAKAKGGSLLNDDREQYLTGGGSSPEAPSKAKQVMSGIERMGGAYLNPYYKPIETAIGIASQAQVGDKVIDPSVISVLDKANSTVNKIVQGVVDTVVPGGSTPIRDLIKARRARKKAEAEEEEEVEEEPTTQGAFRGGRISKQMGELVTQEDQPILDDQMNALAISATPAKIEEIPEEIQEQEMLPDEEMEEDYVDYIIESTLAEEDKNYLESALTKDAKLSEIFDQVVESASEFSGSGPVEGLGSEVSDSIPARLSDGEFVFTAKAVDEIGADVLQQQMEAAEAGADGRQGVAYGGVPDEDKKADIAVATQGSILAAGGVPPVVPIDPIREDQILSMQSSSPRRGYRTISG